MIVFDIHGVDFGLFKNRELVWNVKDKDTESREMDADRVVRDAEQQG